MYSRRPALDWIICWIFSSKSSGEEDGETCDLGEETAANPLGLDDGALVAEEKPFARSADTMLFVSFFIIKQRFLALQAEAIWNADNRTNELKMQSNKFLAISLTLDA